MKTPEFPKLDDAFRLNRLSLPSGKLEVVLDTDAYNEIDDQFALAYALLSKDRIALQAVHVAPFQNSRSPRVEDSIELSHAEILRVFEALGEKAEGKVFRGASGYLPGSATPFESDAARDLISRAMSRTPEEDPLIVVAIGAITNVASAILMEPRIIERIVVVWLGGHGLHWHDNREFNLIQDIPAAQVVFNCGVPLVHVPCWGVTSHLVITAPDIENLVEPCGRIGKYLGKIYREEHPDPWGSSHVLWDAATIAFLINEKWTVSHIINSPVVTDNATWSVDHRRHLIRYIAMVWRDPIVKDLLSKFQQAGSKL
jgi:purine nucleosidase